MNGVSFANPNFLWLLMLIPMVLIWYIFKFKYRSNGIYLSSKSLLAGYKVGFKVYLQHVSIVLRSLALAALIVALARPQSKHSWQDIRTEGIDIMLAVDISASMLAKDLKPNRLEALKKVASTFVQDRINDRIGLVVYAGESYTRTPVTSDKTIILQSLKTIEYDDSIIADGTGIGVGLATAINRIKDSKAKSRIIILLTDGVNNSGTIDPRTASEIAKEYGIKVYTIGIGTNGQAMFPVAKDANGKLVFRMMPVEIDEKLMKEIAKATDAKYFRATSNKKLQAIYNEINKLETTEIQEKKFYNYDEKYKPFVFIAFVLLGVEVLLRNSVFRGIV